MRKIDRVLLIARFLHAPLAVLIGAPPVLPSEERMHYNSRMIGRMVAAFLALAMLAGCPGPWHTHDTAALTLRSSVAVNVRVHLLKEDGRFLAASPADLASKGGSLLGEDLIAQKEVSLSPGPTSVRVDLGERPPQAKAVGILVLHDGTKAAGETWHAAVRLEDLDTVVVELRDRTLKLVSR